MTLKRCSVFVLMLSLGGGCSPMSMAKRGFTELKGASGKVVPVRDANHEFYRSIGTLKIGSVTNSIKPVCPLRMQSLITAALKTEAVDATNDLSGTRICTAEVEITYNQPPKGVQALIGKGAILLGRARLFDERQEMHADLLIGVFSKAMRTTEEEMATAFGRTLADHVIKRSD